MQKEKDKALCFLEAAQEWLAELSQQEPLKKRPVDFDGLCSVLTKIRAMSEFFGLTLIHELSARALQCVLLALQGEQSKKLLPLLSDSLEALGLLCEDYLAGTMPEPRLTEIEGLERLLKKWGVEDSMGLHSSIEIALEEGFRLQLPSPLRAQLVPGERVHYFVMDYLQDLEAQDELPCTKLDKLLSASRVLTSQLQMPRHDGIPFCVVLASDQSQGDLEGLVKNFRFHWEFAAVGEGLELVSRREGLSQVRPAQELQESSKKKAIVREAEPKRPSSSSQAKSRGEASPQKAVKAAKEKSPKPRVKPSQSASKEADSIRVRLRVLDRLMTLAGELVLTRNQLVQSFVTGENQVEDATQRIDHITTELQDAIMATRMQSVGVIFHKFRRLVRDIAGRMGKEVDLILEGEDVELDRTIIEAISDPLTHLVRNALDHGLEDVQQREAAGKCRTGTLKLRAYHKAGNVIIEVNDDGKGIDTEKVKAKALNLGLYSMPQLEAMPEAALLKLVFKPGLSTAKSVTDLSGRGVGMDVVVSNLNRVGGVVDLESQPGYGTTFRIKLPLTLAIIPSLLVTEEGERFAIPQASLVELQRIPAAEASQVIEKIGEVNVMRLRGELLPLVRLRDLLGMPQRSFEAEQGRQPDHRMALEDRRQEAHEVEDDHRSQAAERRQDPKSAVNIAIVAAGDFHYGLILESLLDSAEIVVKPLGRHLRSCVEYAGATILGDGCVALILDVMGLSKAVSASLGFEDEAGQGRGSAAGGKNHDYLSVVLVKHGDTQIAIPLGLVVRIERVAGSRIRTIAARRTLDYRGRSLPLLELSDLVSLEPLPETSHYYVIIFRMGTRQYGLLVSRLIDIIDAPSEIDEGAYSAPGVFGSLLIDDELTLLADIHALARASESEAPGRSSLEFDLGQKEILVVDDSSFFRTKLIGYIEEMGHRTQSARNGREALDLLEARGEEFDLVLTDIEMPEMNGFELAKEIRANHRFDALPVLAVTSLVGEQAEQRGREAGIDDYLIKLDKDNVLVSATHFLQHGRAGGAR